MARPKKYPDELVQRGVRLRRRRPRRVLVVRFQLHATIEKWAQTPQGLASLVPTRTERIHCTTHTRSHIKLILRAALPTVRVGRKR